MNEPEIVDLEEGIFLSPRAVANWSRVAREAARRLIREGLIKSGDDVPIEQGRVNADGTLTIFVEGAGWRIEAVVPRSEWERRNN